MTKKRKAEEEPTAASISSPPPFTADTLRHRLLTGTMIQSGGQKGSLTRCVQKFALLNHSGGEESSSDKEKLRDELIQELTLYQMELTRLVLLQQTLEKEVKENENTEKEIQQEIQDLSVQVQASFHEADRAKQVQSCFMEYEVLAKLANSNQTSSSRVLKQKIETMKQEIDEQKKEEALLNQTLEVRSSQFQLLIQYMLDLKRSLAEEEEANDNQGHNPSAMEVDKQNEEQEDGLYGDL